MTRRFAMVAMVAMVGGCETSRLSGTTRTRSPCRIDMDCPRAPGQADCVSSRCDRGVCVAERDDTACDDGTFCNGAERCDPAAGCVAVGPRCDDGIPCTREACDEAARRCVVIPDPDRCSSGDCNRDRGCVETLAVLGRRAAFELRPPVLVELSIGDREADLSVLPTTTRRVLLEGLPEGGLTDVAAGSSPGTLVVAFRDGFRSLALEPADIGAWVPVGPPLEGLARGRDGTLLGLTTDAVVTVDEATGATAPLHPLPPGLRGDGGDLVEAGDGSIVALVQNGADTWLLVTFAASDIAPETSPLPDAILCPRGLGAVGDQLVVVTCAQLVHRLDPTTNRAIPVANIPADDPVGAARLP